MKRTKLLPLLLSALLLLSASGCRPAEAPSQSGGAISSVSSSTSSSGIPAPNDEVLPIDLAVLSGPTGVGAAYLMEYYAPEHVPADSPISVSSVVVTENSEATALLSNGEADIAAVATNVASNFYHKTDGSIQMLAVNTMGVLYILEKGDSIQSMADLRGKTIYATGQGANPEYILNYLLTQNGLDPAADVTIQWLTAQEVTANMLSAEDGVCMLPVPAATALLMKDPGVRQALDLSAEWDAVSSTPLPMGCIVARREFVEEHPEAVDAFLDLFGDSISFMSDEGNRSEAAELVAKYGITANAQIAEAAIPQCNLTLLTGEEMQDTVQAYYEVLYRADPAAIGASPMTACTICPDRLLRPLLPLAFWLVVWQLAALAVGQSFILPGPAAVLGTLIQLAGVPSFWQTALLSLVRVLAGLLAGTLLGALTAALTCASRWADVLLSPAVRVIRAVPVVSFILFVLLWTRRGLVPVVVSALMVLPVVWGNVGRGIRETDPKLLEQAGALRFSRLKTVRLVYLPSVRPYFLSAVVTSLGLAWKSGVAAEVLCRPAWAVGTQIVQARDYLETPSLFAWTLVIVLVSLAFEKVFLALLKRGEHALERM